jgi:hypothetical protein
MKFISIIHSERNIWNGSIVATAIRGKSINQYWREMAASPTERSRSGLEFARCKVLWRLNAHSDGNLDVVVTNETAYVSL